MKTTDGTKAWFLVILALLAIYGFYKLVQESPNLFGEAF